LIQRDEALVQSLGISVAQVAAVLKRSRQTVNRGIHGSRDYFKPVDLTKALYAWRDSNSHLYSIAKTVIAQAYPEISTAILSAAEQQNLSAFSHGVFSTNFEQPASISREAAINSVLLTKYPASYETDFSRARQLSIMGLNLRRIIHAHVKDISLVLDRGGNVDIILLNPNCQACKYAAIQEFGRSDSKSVLALKNSIQQAYISFCELKRERERGANLTVKIIDYVPPFGLDAMEFDDANECVIYVRYYPIKTEVDDRPILALRADDGYWYQFFKEQFVRNWKLATDWQYPQKQSRDRSNNARPSG
jgi:hypothetical protein